MAEEQEITCTYLWKNNLSFVTVRHTFIHGLVAIVVRSNSYGVSVKSFLSRLSVNFWVRGIEVIDYISPELFSESKME